MWSNSRAQPHTDPAEVRDFSLSARCWTPVRWEETMRNLLAEGVNRFEEIGPGRVLAGLLKRVDRKMECRNTQA
ncbi:MAG: hypothetical protein U0744_20350 [Gemmataceae bacterium]